MQRHGNALTYDFGLRIPYGLSRNIMRTVLQSETPVIPSSFLSSPSQEANLPWLLFHLYLSRCFSQEISYVYNPVLVSTSWKAWIDIVSLLEGNKSPHQLTILPYLPQMSYHVIRLNKEIFTNVHFLRVIPLWDLNNFFFFFFFFAASVVCYVCRPGIKPMPQQGHH